MEPLLVSKTEIEQTLELPRFNDMHVHFRNPDDARGFARASAMYCDHVLAMPNTVPPILTAKAAFAYSEEIERIRPLRVVPTILLTPRTSRTEIDRCTDNGILAAKYYPKGMTTNSDHGIEKWQDVEKQLRWMEEKFMVLCIHPESCFAEDVLDREERFLVEAAAPIHEKFPKLRMVMEHITTELMVDWVWAQDGMVVATITGHHLHLTLNDLIGDKLEPRNFCKPVAKRVADREALVNAATSSDGRYFLGSDSAPHSEENKFGDHGCAGCFTAPILPTLLCEVFEQEKALENLPDFVNHRARDFYGLQATEQTIKMNKLHESEETGGVWTHMEQHVWYPVFGGRRMTQWWMEHEPEQDERTEAEGTPSLCSSGDNRSP